MMNCKVLGTYRKLLEAVVCIGNIVRSIRQDKRFDVQLAIPLVLYNCSCNIVSDHLGSKFLGNHSPYRDHIALHPKSFLLVDLLGICGGFRRELKRKMILKFTSLFVTSLHLLA